MDPPATAAPTDAPPGPRPTAGRRPASLTRFLLVAVMVLAADLGLKAYAFSSVAGTPVAIDASAPPYFGVPHHEPAVLIPGLLDLHLTANDGAIFGLGGGSRWIFVVVSLVAIVFVGRVFGRSPAGAVALHIALALILAGALGNLYDRVCFAVVRDMLHLFPGTNLPWGLAWPGGVRGLYPWVFNLADVALLFGVITVLCVTWRNEWHPPTPGKAPG